MPTPMIRIALLAALAAGGTLTRGRAGFGPVTRRTANALHRDGLMRYDNPAFPCALTLTPAGRIEAERLQAATGTARARTTEATA